MEQAGPLVIEQFGEGTVVRGDHRHSRRHGLDRGQPLRLGPRRGQGEDVDRREQVELRLPVDLAEPAKAVGHIEVTGKGVA